MGCAKCAAGEHTHKHSYVYRKKLVKKKKQYTNVYFYTVFNKFLHITNLQLSTAQPANFDFNVMPKNSSACARD